ncbi:MAG: hypothetical protein WA864_27740 [Acetobacteraceae bacterium]|jgi:hypothetical protein
MARRLIREQLQEWAGARRGRYERVGDLGHIALDPPGIAISVADTYPTELPG